MLIAREQCDEVPCQNAARYTTVDSRRVCALHAMGVLAMKDSDIPTFISAIHLSASETTSIPAHQRIRELCGLLGRIEPSNELSVWRSSGNKLADGFERAEALKVACPWCYAKPGEDCILASGTPIALVTARAVHDRRIQAAFPDPSQGKPCERCGKGPISRMGVCDNCGDDSEGPYV